MIQDEIRRNVLKRARAPESRVSEQGALGASAVGAAPSGREAREEAGELLALGRGEVGERPLDRGAPVIEHVREGGAARFGDDEDAASGVARIDFAAHMAGVHGRLHEPARARLVDTDQRGEVAHRARAALRERDEQAHRGMATAAARSAVTRRASVIAMRVGAERAAVTVVTPLVSTPSPGSAPDRAGAERTRPERPGSPGAAARSTAAERAEGRLDRRDRVLRGPAGLVGPVGPVRPVGPAGPLGTVGTVGT